MSSTKETIAPIIAQTYGDTPMSDALATELARVIDAENDVDEHQIMLLCWNWFSGGTTADSVTKRIVTALEDRELSQIVREVGERLGFHWEPDCSAKSMIAKMAGEIELWRRDYKEMLR